MVVPHSLGRFWKDYGFLLAWEAKRDAHLWVSAWVSTWVSTSAWIFPGSRTASTFLPRFVLFNGIVEANGGSLRRILRMRVFWQVTAGGRYICKLKDGSIIGEASCDPLHTMLWLWGLYHSLPCLYHLASPSWKYCSLNSVLAQTLFEYCFKRRYKLRNERQSVMDSQMFCHEFVLQSTPFVPSIVRKAYFILFLLLESSWWNRTHMLHPRVFLSDWMQPQRVSLADICDIVTRPRWQGFIKHCLSCFFLDVTPTKRTWAQVHLVLQWAGP